MIPTIVSAYEAAAGATAPEPHVAWRRAWQRLRDGWRGGRRIGLDELAGYLADVPIEDQQEAACDLIAEHLRLFWRAGDPLLEDYAAALQSNLPWLADPAALPADLVEDEYLVRCTPPGGEYPLLADYARRFPQRPDIIERLARRCLAGERYVKLRVLGAGALGVVYEAYDRAADRLVAVKEASPADAASRERLFGEMQLTAELDHPSIVPIYDFGRSDPSLPLSLGKVRGEGAFYVMALITGQTLGEQIRDYHANWPARSRAENRAQLRRLIECLIQMCHAVDHAHQRGIVHRDLKPANVIVDDAGCAVIVDWGLARRLDEGTMRPVRRMTDRTEMLRCAEHDTLEKDGRRGREVAETIIVGTPQYMAPEQASNREDQRSDVFSLGATLYEILTGRPPYDWPAGAVPADWPAIVRQARIARPRTVASAAPRRLEAICLKALAKEPADRHASAGELAGELRAFLAGDERRSGWLSWFAA